MDHEGVREYGMESECSRTSTLSQGTAFLEPFLGDLFCDFALPICMSIISSLHCSGEVHFWTLKLRCMLAKHKETGLMVVPCRNADAVFQVLGQAKDRAGEMAALAWCQSMLLFFAQRSETQWMNGSIIWQREDH